MPGFRTSLECTNETIFQLYTFMLPLIVRPWRDAFLIAIIQPIISGFGLLLNGIFIALVFKRESLKSITNIYLGNLAIADSIYLSFTCMSSLLTYFMTPFNDDFSFIGPNACFINQYVPYSSSYASMFLITIVTFERYLAICSPLKHRQIVSRGRTFKLIAGCWACALVLAIPSSFKESKYTAACLEYPEPGFEGWPSMIGLCSTEYIHVTMYTGYLIEFGVFLVSFIGKCMETLQDIISKIEMRYTTKTLKTPHIHPPHTPRQRVLLHDSITHCFWPHGPCDGALIHVICHYFW